MTFDEGPTTTIWQKLFQHKSNLDMRDANYYAYIVSSGNIETIYELLDVAGDGVVVQSPDPNVHDRPPLFINASHIQKIWIEEV